MKLHHEVVDAPAEPQVNLRYGAKLQSMRIEGGKVICSWSVYTRRHRNGLTVQPKEKAK